MVRGRTLSGANRAVELTINGKVVSGTFELFEDTATNQTFWSQLHYISPPKGFVFSKPIAYRVGSGMVKESTDLNLRARRLGAGLNSRANPCDRGSRQTNRRLQYGPKLQPSLNAGRPEAGPADRRPRR